MPEPRALAARGDGLTPPAPRPRTGAPGATGLRRAILLRLRQDGPSSPDQLAARLGASRTGILQQLGALEAARLVRHETERHGVGRPRHLYDVTEEAQDLFPTNYDGLAAGLLEAIGAIGGEDLVEEVFAARRRQIGDRVRRELADRIGADASLEDRVRELATIQDEQGYLCEAQPMASGGFRLREHNCAIYHVAKAAMAACDAELDLFREILGVEVVRESHIASGDRCCSYRIAEGQA